MSDERHLMDFDKQDRHRSPQASGTRKRPGRVFLRRARYTSQPLHDHCITGRLTPPARLGVLLRYEIPRWPQRPVVIYH